MPRPKSLSEVRVHQLETWLAGHHHVVARRDLKHLGIPKHYADSEVRARRWQRIYPGVWCAYTGPLTFESRCAAALAALGPEAALDAESAAAVLGLRRPSLTSVVRVVIPHGSRRKRLGGVELRQSRTLSDRSCQVRNGLRVVRIERAVLSIALRRRGNPGAVSDAVQQGLTTAERVRGTLLGLGNVAGRARVLTAIADVDGGSRSELERLFIALVRRAGLPRPAQNHALTVDGRRLWIDVAYPELRIAIEIDGKAYHLFAEDWANDLDRQNTLVLDGWLVLRFTARVIRERPDAVVTSVRAAITSRGLVSTPDWSAGAA